MMQAQVTQSMAKQKSEMVKNRIEGILNRELPLPNDNVNLQKLESQEMIIHDLQNKYKELEEKLNQLLKTKKQEN